METCNYLLYLALILMCTKFLGLLTRRARMPQVVGALLAGLLLGPAVFKIIPQTEFLTQTAEVGVVILMFCAGMETDVKELKKCGKAATIIAVIGFHRRQQKWGNWWRRIGTAADVKPAAF